MAMWQAGHAICLVVGGLSFCAGTACYYFVGWRDGPMVSAVLYIAGSCGFLAVDLIQIATYREDTALQFTISCSAVGSLIYVIGSFGFLPSVELASPRLGFLCFLLGSVLIGTLQLWKTYRILAAGHLAARADQAADVELSAAMSAEGRQLAAAAAIAAGAAERVNAIGIELSAGMGAWCFFVGSVMYGSGRAIEGPFLWAIVGIWLVGSWLFTQGGAFLLYRQIIMLRRSR